MKSAATIPLGLAPTATFVSVVNAGASAAVTVLSPILVVARSARPSPLKSPAVMVRGVVPVAKLICGENPVPELSRMATELAL